MKKFEICYSLAGDNTFIIPSLLHIQKPSLEWDDKDNIHFEFHYTFMPGGIMARFIVRTHDLIKNNLLWKKEYGKDFTFEDYKSKGRERERY